MATRMPGINHRVPQTSDLLEYEASSFERELLLRTRLLAALSSAEQNYGIVATRDPRRETGDTLSAPLVVVLNQSTPTNVDVLPGLVLFPSGLVAEITSTVTKAPYSIENNAQSVVYAQYTTTDQDVRATRTMVGGISAKRVLADDASLIQVSSLSTFNGMSSERKKNVVALALLTASVADDGSVSLTVDMTADVLNENRPWFSPVDIKHRMSVGSGTPTEQNPHGLTANDFDVYENTSLYNFLLGRGVVVSPPGAYAEVPGSLACSESLLQSRWKIDTTGDITGYPNSAYVKLIGFPISLGNCEDESADEVGTSDAKLLALRQVPKTNIVFLEPGGEYCSVTFVGPNVADAQAITIVCAYCGLSADVVFQVIRQTSSTESVTYSSSSRTLTINFVSGVSTTNSIVARIRSTVGSSSDFKSIRGSGTTAWTASSSPYSATVNNQNSTAQVVVRYTRASVFEPPNDYRDSSILDFGSPESGELVVANGRAYGSISSVALSTERLGPIPRRVWALYAGSSLGFLHIPQVLVPYSSLNDSMFEAAVAVSSAFYGPGKVRLWLSGATAGANLNVQLTLSGKNVSGTTVSETLTFGSSWVDNASGSSTELPEQSVTSTNMFASDLTITLVTREQDGPTSAILIELIPDLAYQKGGLDQAGLLASFFWNGFTATDMYDEREVITRLTQTGGAFWRRIGAGMMAAYSLLANEGSNVNLLFGEDSESIRHSDLLLTRRWAPLSYADTYDPLKSSASRHAQDAWYYSRAVPVPTDTRFIELVLYDAQAVGSGQVQLRYASTTTPDVWEDWLDLTAETNALEGFSEGATAFYTYLGDGVSARKIQLRLVARWRSFTVYTATTNLKEFQLAEFDVEHVSGTGGGDDGKHKEITIVPQAGAATRRRIYAGTHSEDKSGSGLANLLLDFLGWSDLGAENPVSVFTLKVGGDWFFFGTYQGQLRSTGGLDAGTGDIVSDGGDLNLRYGEVNAYRARLVDYVEAPRALAHEYIYYPSTMYYSKYIPIGAELAAALKANENAAGGSDLIAKNVALYNGDTWDGTLQNIVAITTNDATWWWDIDLNPYLSNGVMLRSVVVIAKSIANTAYMRPVVFLAPIATGYPYNATPDYYADAEHSFNNGGASGARQEVTFNFYQFVNPNWSFYKLRLCPGPTTGNGLLQIYGIRLVFGGNSVDSILGKV